VAFLSAGERAAVTAKARIFRGRLLSPSDYLRLLECGTVGDIAVYLSRTPAYEAYFQRIPHPEQLHRGDLEGTISTAPMLEELPFCHYLGPERTALLRAWGERFDVDVVKRVLRMITTGVGNRDALRRRVASVPITLADGEKLLEARTLRDVQEAIRGYPLEKVLTEPLKQAERQSGAPGQGGFPNLFRAKMAMDTFFLTRILSEGGRLPGSEGRGVRRIFGTRADLINLYWIYRGRRFFAMTPEEALGMTLPVRYKLNFEALSAFAFAPDVPAMMKLMRESRYRVSFTPGGDSGAGRPPVFREGPPGRGEEVEVSEMTLEHNLYRILWRMASSVFASGSSGVHVALAYLTLRELEVKDLFTIIEDVRYQYDKKKAREFLIHPGANSFTAGEGGDAAWQSSR
jgi:V/A-type H+-transporting ATPase subunit C